MKVSITLDYCEKGTINDKIKYIKEAGFTHVNLSSYICNDLLSHTDDKLLRLKKILDYHNLFIDWFHAPFYETKFYSLNNETWSLSIAAVRLSIKIAAALQANTIVIHPVNIDFPENIMEDKYKERILKAFEVFLNEGKKEGINIAAENLIAKPTHELLKFLMENLKELSMCFDAGHANLTNKWDYYLPEYINRITAIHIHDNHGKNDEHLIPGYGNINYNNFIKQLIKYNYRGVWGLECTQRNDNYTGEPGELAKIAFENFNNIYETARNKIDKKEFLSI